MATPVVELPMTESQNPEPGRPFEDSAVVSMRAVTALEIASVLASVLISMWVIAPLQPEQLWLAAIPALLALALIINSQRLRAESLAEIGLTVRHFGRALSLVALPTIVACGFFVLIGYLSGSLHRTTHFWSNVLFLPVWGLLQQYVLQGFLHRRVNVLLAGGTGSRVNRAVIATAVIFALLHAPNLTLIVLTFAGALIWSWVYTRAPNLFALAISHAAISLTLMNTLPPWLLESMSVGYKHFLYQRF